MKPNLDSGRVDYNHHGRTCAPGVWRSRLHADVKCNSHTQASGGILKLREEERCGLMIEREHPIVGGSPPGEAERSSSSAWHPPSATVRSERAQPRRAAASCRVSGSSPAR